MVFDVNEIAGHVKNAIIAGLMRDAERQRDIAVALYNRGALAEAVECALTYSACVRKLARITVADPVDVVLCDEDSVLVFIDLVHQHVADMWKKAYNAIYSAALEERDDDGLIETLAGEIDGIRAGLVHLAERRSWTHVSDMITYLEKEKSRMLQMWEDATRGIGKEVLFDNNRTVVN
jgi:hypothetical protein